MIVCSCNVLSDKQVAAVLVGKPGPLRMSQVYACLGCRRSAVGASSQSSVSRMFSAQCV